MFVQPASSTKPGTPPSNGSLLPYRTDHFEGTFHRLDGARFWHFLHEHDNILRMEAATYLGRPAVEPLSPALMHRFGGEVAQKPIKQMIGHMVRQIMEARGFLLERANVRIRRHGNIFYCGSRYKHTSHT
ncbi:MAG: hypothetical protein AAF744_06320 [Pseudomonadota bacterium]